MKIKKGDQVEIIAGKDKGKRGQVVRTVPAARKVVVEGFNFRTQHVKASRQGEKGQRIQVAAPLDVSNVMLVCPHTSKVTRVGYRIQGDRKVRISKRAQKEI